MDIYLKSVMIKHEITHFHDLAELFCLLDI